MNWLVNFVKEKEGFRSQAYEDIVGVWTIGYGHTHGVKKGDEITEKVAAELLEEELQDYLNDVVRYQDAYNYEWSTKQVAALASFTYNLGKRSIRQLTDNGTRSNEVIAEKMLLYKNAGGKPVRGLEIRRQEEADHFNS